MVLTGATPAGGALALDTQIPTYVVDWPQGATQPLLYPSRGYPVHQCLQKGQAH
jgi:hypothetical protein